MLRPVSLLLYVNTQIININRLLSVYQPQRKSYGGLSSIGKGKGKG
jgi:hypothetical protein